MVSLGNSTLQKGANHVEHVEALRCYHASPELMEEDPLEAGGLVSKTLQATG